MTWKREKGYSKYRERIRWLEWDIRNKENKRTRIINFLTKKPVIVGLCVTALKATFSPKFFSVGKQAVGTWGP